MPDYPESSDSISPLSIKVLQRDVGGEANLMSSTNVSRGAFGPDVLNDSVIYCARNFSVNERVDYNQGCNIDKYIDFPETLGGPYYDADPVSSDPITAPHASVWHSEERRRWRVIPSHSVSRLLTEADTSISTSVTTDDWTGSGDYASTDSLRSSFGRRLLNIPNNGNGYSLMFHTDINLAHSLDNDYTLNPKEFKRWLGGQRVWTSVVYVLKPSEKSTRVLCWSPGHMIGASGNEIPESAFMSKYGQSPTATVDITHSYTDVIRINNNFIRRLCNARGVDFDSRKMSLDSTSFFGWIVVGGLDRWDYVPPYGGLEGAVSDLISGPGESYDRMQKIHVNGGTTNIIAFKDEDAGNELEDTSSLIHYTS